MGTETFGRRHFLKLCAVSMIGILGAGSLSGVLDNKVYASPTRPIHNLDKIPGKENLVARIAIASDLHVGYGDGANTATDKILNAFAVIGNIAPDTDAFIFAGDMVNVNDQAERSELFTKVLPHLGDYFASTPDVHVVMGNHDCQNYSTTEFERDYGTALGKIYDPKFSTDALPLTDYGQKQNTMVRIAGIPVIKLAPFNPDNTGWAGNRCDYRYLYSFLKRALDDAVATTAPGLPIIVASHYGLKSVAVNEDWYGEYGEGEGSIPELLKEYPQVLFFSGHIHNDLASDDFISNEPGFTCVATSTLGSYLEDNNDGTVQADSQGLLVDVYSDSKIIIHRLDFANNVEHKPYCIEI